MNKNTRTRHIAESPVGGDVDRLPDELFHQIANAIGLAATDVVGPMRSSPLHEQSVRPNRVADIGDIPPRVEVANAQDRFAQAGLGLRDLPREACGGE